LTGADNAMRARFQGKQSRTL